MIAGRPTAAKVARIWRGRTRAEAADAYQRYIVDTGIPPLAATALGVHLLRRDQGRQTEFLTVSWWESVEAMARFTGRDPRRIRHLDRDPEFLVTLPRRVAIMDVVASHTAR